MSMFSKKQNGLFNYMDLRDTKNKIIYFISPKIDTIIPHKLNLDYKIFIKIKKTTFS